jgi:hypothetical protein
MGQLFDEFLAGKDQWKSIARKPYFRELLTKAVATEKDVPVERVLDILVAAFESLLLAPPAVYAALAERGKPGWLASVARKAVADPKKAKRMEAARWLQYGRAGSVSREDLDALRILLTDKDEDVRSAARFPLMSMVAEDPDQVVAHLKSWIDSVSLDQQLGIAASLAPAWGSRYGGDVFAMQEPLLADPKYRYQFVRSVDLSLNSQPISLKAAEAGWDKLLAPAVERLLSGEWKPAPNPTHDRALLRLMGKTLALRPAPEMIRRADALAERLVQAADKRLSPAEIIYAPQRELGALVTGLWPGYREWWEKIMKAMSKPALKKLWREDLKECEEGLRELVEAEATKPGNLEKLTPFQRSALEFSRPRRSK